MLLTMKVIIQSVLCLQDHGPHIDSKGWVASSALFAASEMGNIDVMKTRIERGLDVSVVNEVRNTTSTLHLGQQGSTV
jgi:hypothetical protein